MLRRTDGDLKKKTYRPEAVRRGWIPKPDGTKRPLGVPTIRDGVAQMAAVPRSPALDAWRRPADCS
jgi:retron-type reverse transcriptase